MCAWLILYGFYNNNNNNNGDDDVIFRFNWQKREKEKTKRFLSGSAFLLPPYLI